MEVGGPVYHPLLQYFVCTSQGEVSVPLPAKCSGQLAACNCMKWLFEEENAVCGRNLLAEIFRFRKQRAAHQHDVYVRVDLADAGRSFDAVDPGGHADVQEDDGLEPDRLHRMLDSGNSRQSLVPRV